MKVRLRPPPHHTAEGEPVAVTAGPDSVGANYRRSTLVGYGRCLAPHKLLDQLVTNPSRQFDPSQPPSEAAGGPTQAEQQPEPFLGWLLERQSENISAKPTTL